MRELSLNVLDIAQNSIVANASLITLDIRSDASNDTLVIRIEDNGKGILKEDIRKVTQKFYKGKGAKRGSGIGLALVKEIITAHGGEFIIESEYGVFTRMTFVLHTIRSMKGK